MRVRDDDRGVVVLWVAALLLFFMGMAALAVDASGFFEDARFEQTVADLSCLAGVRELPEDAPTARLKAADFVRANWSAFSPLPLPAVGSNPVVWGDGAGNQVVITTAAGGDPTKMAVEVTQEAKASFGRVLGIDTVSIRQEATCQVLGLASGSLPFGVLPGTYNGGLQAPNPCGQNSGNCGQVFIKRLDGTTGTGPTFIANLAEGSDRELFASWGPGDPRIHCTTSSSVACSVIETDTGVSANHLSEGMVRRLEKTQGSDCTFPAAGTWLDCDSLSQVLGGSPSPLSSRPAEWHEGVHGPWPPSNPGVHYYYDGVVAKCGSPRLGSVPIISSDLDYDPNAWSPGDPYPEWPNGSKDVKVLGGYFIYLDEPNDPGDFSGGGKIKSATAKVVWLGPDASCVGPNSPTKPFETGDAKVIRLVAG